MITLTAVTESAAERCLIGRMRGNELNGRAELERLYLQYGTLVFRRAQSLLGDEQRARDVCQDVFVEILRSLPWDPPSPVGWLYTATTHRCLNELRAGRRWRNLLRSIPRPSTPAASIPLRAFLHRIPERLQEIAVYYGIDRMSQDEIALVLGVSQKTVSNRIRELRALLANPGPGGVLEVI
jgi:RNA polymerase sigma factor (sigma-70 family)